MDGTVPALIEKTVEGTVDVFLSPGQERTDGLHYEHLFDEAVLLCVPSAWEINREYAAYRIPCSEVYKLFQQQNALPPVPLDILRNLPFVGLPENQYIGALAKKLFDALGTPCRCIVTAEQMMTSYAMTVAGVGASLITETALLYGNYLERPTLYLISREFYHRSMFAVCARQRARSMMYTAFLAVLREALHDYIG